MKTLQIFNDENATDGEIQTFRHRLSTRAVVVDDQNNVAMLYSKKLDYYELPGGGIDEGETAEQSIIRECQEEIGCEVEIIREVGKTLEVRKTDQLTNEAACYLVRVIGDKGVPQLMSDEIEEGFVTVWVTPDQARQFLIDRMTAAQKLYHRYMTDRGLLFIEEVFFKDNNLNY